MGDLRTGMFPQPLLRREMLCAIPPSFSSENFLSGVDYRRFRLFQARSGLRLQGKKDGKSRTIPERFQGSLGPPLPDTGSRLEMGELWTFSQEPPPVFFG